MATRIPFIKTYSTPHELVQLLKTRGMEITDEEKAVHYLSHIGYYRLSAYMYPLLSIPKEQHLFKQGVTFGKVMRLYRFDKKLRLLLFNEIEKIEVAVRCAIVNFGTEMTGNPFWMTDADNFSNPSKFNRSIRLIEDELNHTKEDFINHFKETYTNQYPPSWMLTEILPFGVITNIYSNIKNKKIKKRIAQSFGLQVAPFESWLTVITVTRNSCCHHARVWNRVVRCAIVNFGTEMTGNPFWMTDADNFSNPSKFNRSIRLIEDELNHTKEDFINHFKETYTNQYPPSWMLTEILPFGVITNIYSNIKNKKIKKRIAQSFGLQVAPFESWLTVITVTRNSCCHHARVWNRIFSIRATMPIRMSRPWITLPTDPLKVYFDICIIKYFLDIISPNNDMLDKMNRLFATFPEVDKAALGFPSGWENEPLWQ